MLYRHATQYKCFVQVLIYSICTGHFGSQVDNGWIRKTGKPAVEKP